jgi:hypothetical protein
MRSYASVFGQPGQNALAIKVILTEIPAGTAHHWHSLPVLFPQLGRGINIDDQQPRSAAQKGLQLTEQILAQVAATTAIDR